MHLAELSPTQTSANRSLVRALKYMPALLLGPLALYEYSPAFCLIAVIASLMALAFASRIKSIEKQSHRHAPLARRLMGDGGSFPNTEAQQPQPLFRPPAVVDGGSMEHHRP